MKLGVFIDVFSILLFSYVLVNNVLTNPANYLMTIMSVAIIMMSAFHLVLVYIKNKLK